MNGDIYKTKEEQNLKISYEVDKNDLRYVYNHLNKFSR